MSTFSNPEKDNAITFGDCVDNWNKNHLKTIQPVNNQVVSILPQGHLDKNQVDAETINGYLLVFKHAPATWARLTHGVTKISVQITYGLSSMQTNK